MVSVGMLRNGTDVFVDVLVDSVFLLGEIGLLDGSAVMVARLGVSVGSTVGLVVGVCLCVVVATSIEQLQFLQSLHTITIVSFGIDNHVFSYSH